MITPTPADHLRTRPHTVPWAIDQIDDIQKLRDIAVLYWTAMWGQHEFAAHLIASDCEACAKAADICDPQYACGQYQTWFAQFNRAARAV